MAVVCLAGNKDRFEKQRLKDRQEGFKRFSFFIALVSRFYQLGSGF
jgi:hypothetical protein